MSLWYDQYKFRYDGLTHRSKASIKEQFEEELTTFVGTKAQILEKEKEIAARVGTEYIKVRNDYNVERSSIVNEWLIELFSWYQAPKEVLDLAYSIAYEQGHSSGYSEVESIFEDIVGKFIECYELGLKHGAK